jgi:hypothetical protein
MGKCLKCKVKEAAFLDERGKRAHCHSCKLPGAARNIRKKTKKLSAKVDITKLPARPCVLPVAKIVFAEDTLAAVARVRASMGKPTEVELDISTNGELQATAVGLGSEYVADYAPMATVCSDFAQVLGVNYFAALGVNRAGAMTRRHQHSPLGVLNVATGAKLWRFWEPGAPDDVEPDLVLTVHKGEMLWFPPGWGHEVITLEGQVYAGTDTALAVNWVSWCLPKHLANASVMAMLAGITKEDQRTVQRALSKPQRAQMLAIAGAWASKQ